MRLPSAASLAFVACFTSAFTPHAPLAAQQPTPTVSPRPSFAEPAISPDGSEIAFVSGGDIWIVPAAGGDAHLLVAHPAMESRPLYSPDGRSLAFVSTRTGNADIFVLDLASSAVRRLTYDDASEMLNAWSPDGRWIYFSSTSRDIAGMHDVHRVATSGGTPMPVSDDRYLSEYWGAPAPDNETVAITARGISAGQWWRRGSSHIDQSEIWLVRGGSTPTYEQVTEGGAREGWPMWTPDARTLFYVSDRGAAQNVWRRELGGTARQVTRFTDGRVLWPSISADGRRIAFERDLAIWTLDVGTGETRAVPIRLRGAPAAPLAERTVFTDRIQELALSPDGRKTAFIVRGEVFAASARDGGDAARVTRSAGAESQLIWAPDSRRIVYVSLRGGAPALWQYDFTTETETRLTGSDQGDATPRFSPDGKLLAFVRGGRELRVLDVAARRDRAIATGTFGQLPFVNDEGYTWSPDGRWLAFFREVEKGFSNIFVVPVADGEPRQVSWLSNVFGSAISWSPDGTFLLASSRQRTEPGTLIRIDLVPRTPRFREDQFRDLFRPDAPNQRPADAPPGRPAPDRTAATPARDSAASAPARAPVRVEIVFDDIRRRATVVPVGVDVGGQLISPDGKSVLLEAVVADQPNLYLYSLDELAREPAVARQITSTPGGKGEVQFSPDGKEIWYLQQGRIQVTTVESRATRPLAVRAELDVDFASDKQAVFAQAWSYLNDWFYDPEHHGVDWAAVRARYAPYVAGARTPDELRRILSLMVGELNASHLGVGGGNGGGSVTGRLGVRFDRAEYERTGRLRISEVLPLSPAAIAGIERGNYLLAVDGASIDARTNLDSLLEHRIGRRVTVSIASSPTGQRRELAIRPVSLGQEKALLYRAWVEDRRAYVARESRGRLGYVHMADMSANALAQLHLDLDAENHAREGVVVDLRNNNGGFVNAYALDVLSRRPYLWMTRRGSERAPARTQLGQRALESPTILVVNQHSLSDAEDFTEGYRTLGLGKIVGEPTAGWIIYTSNVTLLDGTTLRIPFIRITDNAGKDMELAPRPVDIAVTRPVGEWFSGRDSQLDRAIRELLGQLDAMRTSQR